MIKYRTPFGLFNQFILCENKHNDIILKCPKNSLTISERNFVAKSCQIWNFFISDVIKKNEINKAKGYIIPGEQENSDISASISFVKDSLTKLLLVFQSKGSI